MQINLKMILCKTKTRQSPLCLPLFWHIAGLGRASTLAASPAAS